MSVQNEMTQMAHRGGGDVLLLSMRQIAQLVGYSINYEFEDVITEVTAADRLDVGTPEALNWSRRLFKYVGLPRGARRGTGSFPGWHSRLRLERNYELFLPVFNEPYELFALAAIPGWRKHCRFAACFLSELWLSDFPKYLFDLLAPFDHVFLGVQHPVEAVARLTGRPCSYLPIATDVLRFAPSAGSPERPIDFCNIGRRSPVTHQRLLRLAQEREFFYYYDTVAASGIDLKQRTFRVQEPREHRLLLANLMRRTRYCFAHRGRINDPAFTKGRDEISSRMYEGAAAGVVMLGEPPRTAQYAEQFDWPDCLIPVPFDCPQIDSVLAELDSNPARLADIRHRNVHHAARRHDWVHRLCSIFETLGLTPTSKMVQREEQLDSIARGALSGG
jgi:hypothetical protein